MATIVQTAKLISNDKNKFYVAYFIMALLLSAHTLVLNQTLFWIIGWSIYVLALLPMLYILRYAKTTLSFESNNYKPFLLFLCAITGSLFIEHYSLIILGFSIVCLITTMAITGKDKKQSVSLFLGSIIGNAIIFLSPGMLIRYGSESLPGFSLTEKLHFGWSRFIYTFFYMNQRIFFVLSIVLIIYLFTKRQGYLFKTILLLPIAFLSLIIIIKPSLLPATMLECLSGEWSFYTCQLNDLIKNSAFVVYYIAVIFYILLSESIITRRFFNIILYCSLICSGLIFITSNTACERTMFIQYFFLTIIAASFMSEIHSIGKKSIFTFVCIGISLLLICYNSFKYVTAYSREYRVYKENDTAYKACAIKKCKEVTVKQHNYRFIFKSDLNFDVQDTWLFNDIRLYYNLPKDTIIKAKE